MAAVEQQLSRMYRHEAGTDAVRVRRIDSGAGLATFAAEWEALQRASNQRDNLFLTYLWQETWWRTMGEPRHLRLYLLAVEGADGELLGIAPLVLQEMRWLPGVPLRKLLLMGKDVSDYLDFISRPGHEEGVAAAVAHYLREHQQDWDILELTSLPESSDAAAALHRTFARDHLVREEPYVTSLFVQLEGTWEDYLRSRRPKFRQNLRRKRRHFEQELHGRLVSCEGPDEVARALERLFTLSAERLETRGGISNLTDPRRQSFHREIAPLLLARGWVNCSYLEVEGEMAAVRYAYRYGRKFYGANHSFDARWADFGLGSVLYGYSIEGAFAEGEELTEFDLMQGDDAYKYEWASDQRRIHRVLVLAPSLKVRLWHDGRERWQHVEQQVRHRLKAYLPAHLRRSLRLSYLRLQLWLKRSRGGA